MSTTATPPISRPTLSGSRLAAVVQSAYLLELAGR